MTNQSNPLEQEMETLTDLIVIYKTYMRNSDKIAGMPKIILEYYLERVMTVLERYNDYLYKETKDD